MRIEGSIRVFADALVRSVWTYLVVIGTLLTLVLIPRNWYWIVPSGVCMVIVFAALRAVRLVRLEAQSEAMRQHEESQGLIRQLREEIVEREVEIAALKAGSYDEARPDVRIANIQRVGSEQVLLSVANLARPAALVKSLLIGTGGRREQGITPQGVESFPLRFLVTGGQIREDQTIHMQLGEYRRKYSPPPPPVGARSQWQASFSVALVYDCAGTEKQTPWRDFSATLWDYAVVDLACPDEPSP